MALSIVITPLQGVERACARGRIDRILAVLPRSELAAEGMFRRPRVDVPVDWVEFADLENHGPWDTEALAHCAAKGQVLVEDAHVARILAIGREVLAAAAERPYRLLVHCHLGHSRSPAAALLILALQDGPGAEALSVGRLAAIDPDVEPNDRVIRIGDRLLGRMGRLHAACRSQFFTHPPEPDATL